MEAFHEKYPSTIKAVAARATPTGIKDRRVAEGGYSRGDETSIGRRARRLRRPGTTHGMPIPTDFLLDASVRAGLLPGVASDAPSDRWEAGHPFHYSIQQNWS